MKKTDRQLVFNKYNGKCAYCGDPLQKGWHVDEIEPCRRRYKNVPGHWSKGFNENMASEEEVRTAGVYWIPERDVPDGYDHPERLHIDNQNPACPSCNINKHSGSLESFRNLIQGFKKHLNEISTQYKISKRYGLVIEVDKPVVFYFETL